MRRPWEWENPEPVTARDRRLAGLVCDPPTVTRPKVTDDETATDEVER
jgi:hypothetical protein